MLRCGCKLLLVMDSGRVVLVMVVLVLLLLLLLLVRGKCGRGVLVVVVGSG